MLTKKDYIVFASIFKTQNTKEDIIDCFIDYMKKDNPMFDSQMFRKALK